MSLPINIENANKYKRGSFEFNICFIINENTYLQDENRSIITKALKKLAYILT